MATNRVSKNERIELATVAEKEILFYQHDHFLWHLNIHNVELDPMQLLKCIDMDQHPNTIDYSCRRTGKTAQKEMWLLKFLACNSDQELGIVAPREAQSIVNLSYHTDAIRRSPALDNFISYKSGRKQLSDTAYQFANRSVAKAYGIGSQVDGSDLTAASIEEVDDLPRDRLFSRFLLTMGATRRLGAAKDAKNDPQIRITGVYKGADILAELVDSGDYYALPTVDCYLGIELGILNEEFILSMRKQLSAEEFIRQLLCLNVAAKNLIWEKWIRLAIHKGVAARIRIEEPVFGEVYKKRGLPSFGYDHSGHGENPESSRSALVVLEQIGNHTVCIYCRSWRPGEDDNVVKRDLKFCWQYFRPDAAIGDAYGVGMLTTLNDELFTEGLTVVDRRTINDGDSTASAWADWAFVPLRFEGMIKHSMATGLRSLFNTGYMVLPYVDDMPDSDDVAHAFKTLVRQLANIVPVPTKTSYSSYKMAKSKIGDDLFDAMMAAAWALITRGAAISPAIIRSRSQTQQQLLGTPHV